jgi:hypothetical protein
VGIFNDSASVGKELQMGEHEKKGFSDEFEKKGLADDAPDVEGHMFEKKGYGEDFEDDADEFGKKGVAGDFGKKG